MTQYTTTSVPTGPSTNAAAQYLRVGGVCTILGAVVFATARLMHGDTPAAHAEAALDFVASRPTYAAVHLFAVLAALLALAGLVVLVNSLARPAAAMVGRVGLVSSVVGLAVFAVESTSEGLALPELADAATRAAPAERADLVRAAQAVAAATHGPSLVAIALLYGTSLVLFGLAMTLDGYPSWLAWSGMLVGAATLVSAASLYLSPSLFPGALLYGVLASMAVQLWLLMTGLAMLRRGASLAYDS